MKKTLSICLAFFTIVLSIPNQKPIIGIITQQNFLDYPDQKGQKIHSFIAASYVEFIELSGAQVVPIFAYSEQSQIASLLPKLNGVVFPGGGVDFDIKQRWTSNANFIFQYAKKQNYLGKTFPILGICLGHQLLGFLTNNFQNPLNRVEGQLNKVCPIKFISSNMGYFFSDISNQLTQKLESEPGLTFFNHRWAISRQTYEENVRLRTFWRLIAETVTTQNQKFVSVWQARDYPFYGVQFHPQNSIYGWKLDSIKSFSSARISQMISNKFIEKARSSTNSFTDETQFQKSNIYNYQTYPTKLSCVRIYSFNQTKPLLKENLSQI